MENSRIYQSILDNILSLGISPWETIVFYAQYDKDSFEMKFFVKSGKGYQDCFSLGIPDKTVMDAFFKLDKEMQEFRRQIREDKQELWTVMTVTFDSDLHFKSDFDYCAVEDAIEYKSAWKRRFLT